MTITRNNAWVYPEAYEKAMKDIELAKKEGYVEVPDWFPVPAKGYDCKIFGQMTAMIKPKPKLWHILRYKFVPKWWIAWRAKRHIRNLLGRKK